MFLSFKVSKGFGLRLQTLQKIGESVQDAVPYASTRMQQDAGNINILHVRSLRKARVEATHRLQSRMDFCLFLDNVSPLAKCSLRCLYKLICLFDPFRHFLAGLLQMSVLAQLLRFVCFVRFVGKIMRVNTREWKRV